MTNTTDTATLDNIAYLIAHLPVHIAVPRLRRLGDHFSARGDDDKADTYHDAADHLQEITTNGQTEYADFLAYGSAY